MGPDPFIFYRFFAPHFRQGVNKRSHTMHRTKPGEFLMELAKRGQSREMFSYFAGFLCHYAMDSTSQPFIYKTADYQSDMHTAIEHRLDVLELERQRKQRRDLMDLFTQYRKLPEVREAMKSVYGWDDNCYETGYRHMKLYHWIVKDQHGVLNRLLCWFPGILTTIYVEAGIDKDFVQDNESSSTKGVLRGLHFQKNHTQGKLVRVTHGEVFDEAVDVRPGSETYGQWVGVTLSSEKKNMFYIPEGFAHGFLVLSDTAELVYKCTDVYDPTSEGGVPWNDPTIAVDWPKLDVPYKTSEKDEKHEAFATQDFSWAGKWI